MNKIKNKFNNKDNLYYGSGIGFNGQELIDSILKNGLRCSHNQLYFSTISLGQGSNKLFKENEELLNNWPHKSSKHIIIASLPKKFHLLDIMGTPLYGKKHAAFCKSIPNEQAQKLSIPKGLYLKPEFIMGVYDANQKIFISNEQYYENLANEKIKEIMNQVKMQYIEILKASEWSLAEYAQILKDCNIENPLTEEEINKDEKETFRSKIEQPQLNGITLSNAVPSIADNSSQEPALEDWSIDEW